MCRQAYKFSAEVGPRVQKMHFLAERKTSFSFSQAWELALQLVLQSLLIWQELE